MAADHTRAPVLEALVDYRRRGRLPFTPPGHQQARGADPEVRAALGDAVFLGDVLASGGLDDRLTRGRVLEHTEELMADAVHAEHTFFSTCGSSLAVKARERLTEPVLRCPGTGLAAGINLPDPTDPELRTIRVVALDGGTTPDK